jgi:hypothetical protein
MKYYNIVVVGRQEIQSPSVVLDCVGKKLSPILVSAVFGIDRKGVEAA